MVKTLYSILHRSLDLTIKNNAFYMLKEYCRLNYNNDEV
ncbi:hypothetical protein [Staphylococcus aureus]